MHRWEYFRFKIEIIFIFRLQCCPIQLVILVPVRLLLKEECRLRVFENRILRRIFGPQRDENGE
jgi:hypothetical protein